MLRLLTALLGVLLVGPHALAAQDATQDPLLAPGARVRVAYAGEDARIGTLIALAPDTLSVEWPDGGIARMARSRVTRLDVSRGIRQANKAERAKIGFAIGAGLGLAIGALSSSSSSDAECPSSLCGIAEGFATVIGAGMLGGVGAAVGAVSGRGSERWENARLASARVGVIIPVRTHAKSLGLALTF